MANDVGGPDLVNLGSVTGDSNMVPTSTGLPTGVDETTANPLLGPLQYNGGPTPPWRQPVRAAALDNGNNLYAAPTDQNGAPRIIGGQVDIGSVEYNGPTYVLNNDDSGDRLAAGPLSRPPLCIPIRRWCFDPSLAGQTITLSSEILLTDQCGDQWIGRSRIDHQRRRHQPRVRGRRRE